MKNKEIITTIFFIISCLFVYAIFPVENDFQQISAMLIFFVFFPLIYNQLFLKKKLDFYGFGIGDWKQGVIWSFFSLTVIVLIFLIISYYFNFLKNYAIPVSITKSFAEFIKYEFILVCLFVFIYEFYFRGFILFVFEVEMKQLAIFLQALLFLILVLCIGRTSLYLFLPYLLFAPFAGFIAYKSRSILYSGVSQFLIIFVLDALIVKIFG